MFHTHTQLFPDAAKNICYGELCERINSAVIQVVNTEHILGNKIVFYYEFTVANYDVVFVVQLFKQRAFNMHRTYTNISLSHMIMANQ